MTIPTVTVISPGVGTPLDLNTPVVVETEDDVEITVHRLHATFAGVPHSEVVYDGTNFLPPYSDNSVILELIANRKYRFTIIRTGGWPGALTLNTMPVDNLGDVSV